MMGQATFLEFLPGTAGAGFVASDSPQSEMVLQGKLTPRLLVGAQSLFQIMLGKAVPGTDGLSIVSSKKIHHRLQGIL